MKDINCSHKYEQEIYIKMNIFLQLFREPYFLLFSGKFYKDVISYFQQSMYLFQSKVDVYSLSCDSWKSLIFPGYE